MMYYNSDNSIVMIGNDTDTIIGEVFDLLLRKYKKGLAQSMYDSNFIFDYVSEMYYICNKTNLNHGKLCIDYPKCIKSIEATINPKNNDDNCFQFTIMVALNKKDPQTIIKICPLLNQYEWKDTIFSFTCKRLEKI